MIPAIKTVSCRHTLGGFKASDHIAERLNEFSKFWDWNDAREENGVILQLMDWLGEERMLWSRDLIEISNWCLDVVKRKQLADADECREMPAWYTVRMDTQTGQLEATGYGFTSRCNLSHGPLWQTKPFLWRPKFRFDHVILSFAAGFCTERCGYPRNCSLKDSVVSIVVHYLRCQERLVVVVA